LSGPAPPTSKSSPAPPRIVTGTATFLATATRSSPAPELTSKPVIAGAWQTSSLALPGGWAQSVPPTSSGTAESIT